MKSKTNESGQGRPDIGSTKPNLGEELNGTKADRSQAFEQARKTA